MNTVPASVWRWRVGAVIFLVVPLTVFFCSRPSKLAFDAVTWRDIELSTVGDSPLRQRMVRDLIDSEILLGIEEGEVTELLGPPDRVLDSGPKWYVGPEGGFAGIDSEWLLVRFDANGLAARTTLVYD